MMEEDTCQGLSLDNADKNHLNRFSRKFNSIIFADYEPSETMAKFDIANEIQHQIDDQIRMREGAMKLMSACSTLNQALETSKNLLTINARILGLMSALQRKKKQHVLKEYNRQRSSVCMESSEDCCPGRIAMSDIRVPLMWKDNVHFSGKTGDQSYYAFALIRCGDEVRDTSLYEITSADTDMYFAETLIFEDLLPDLKMDFEVYYTVITPVEAHPILKVPRPSITIRSLSRKQAHFSAPKFCLAGHVQICVDDIRVGMISKDLTMGGTGASGVAVLGDIKEFPIHPLELWGQICCELAAQPLCMLDKSTCGYCQIKVEDSWCKCYVEVHQCKINGWKDKDQAGRKIADHVIKLEEDMMVCVDDTGGGSCILNLTINNEILHKLQFLNDKDFMNWKFALRKEIHNLRSWKVSCKELMFIEESKKSRLSIPSTASFYDQIDIGDEPFGIPPEKSRSNGNREGSVPSLSHIKETAEIPETNHHENVFLSTSTNSSSSLPSDQQTLLQPEQDTILPFQEAPSTKEEEVAQPNYPATEMETTSPTISSATTRATFDTNLKEIPEKESKEEGAHASDDVFNESRDTNNENVTQTSEQLSITTSFLEDTVQKDLQVLATDSVEVPPGCEKLMDDDEQGETSAGVSQNNNLDLESGAGISQNNNLDLESGAGGSQNNNLDLESGAGIGNNLEERNETNVITDDGNVDVDVTSNVLSGGELQYATTTGTHINDKPPIHLESSVHLEMTSKHKENTNLDSAKKNEPEENTNLDSAKKNEPEENTNLDSAKVNEPEENTNLDSEKVNEPEENTNLDSAKVNEREENTNLDSAKKNEPEENTNLDSANVNGIEEYTNSDDRTTEKNIHKPKEYNVGTDSKDKAVCSMLDIDVTEVKSDEIADAMLSAEDSLSKSGEGHTPYVEMESQLIESPNKGIMKETIEHINISANTDNVQLAPGINHVSNSNVINTGTDKHINISANTDNVQLVPGINHVSNSNVINTGIDDNVIISTENKEANDDTDISSDNNNDLVSDHNDVIADNNDVITNNNDVITNNSDVITDNNDVIGHNSDVITNNSDVITDNNDIIGDTNDVISDDVISDNKDMSNNTNTNSDNTNDNKDFADDNINVISADVAISDKAVDPKESSVCDNSPDTIHLNGNYIRDESDTLGIEKVKLCEEEKMFLPVESKIHTDEEKGNKEKEKDVCSSTLKS